MDRRRFLGWAARTVAAAGIAPQIVHDGVFAKEVGLVSKPELKKALVYGMLPGDLSMEDRFQLAAECGFDGVEAPPVTDRVECEAMRKAATAAGIEIHSVIYGGWGKPLSAPEPKDRQEGEQAVKDALHGARALGADTLLLVPGRVTEEIRYQDVYERSQASIRKLIPTAKRLGVVIAVENVWNGFLLSPIEFARYVDELDSPFVQAYFDVGNVIGAFGFSQDWIRTLGPRIRRLHVKDFKLDGRQWTNLLDGSVNWKEVRKSIEEVGYGGYMTCELGGGDAAYLKDVAARMDRIITGDL
ncbi:MAG: sugar phosphate isomerase/epimerase [Armatimonadetes bacterium]|nr:sugar phosphate isomerase/epimerase [Armatimonadota bacterium]